MRSRVSGVRIPSLAALLAGAALIALLLALRTGPGAPNESAALPASAEPSASLGAQPSDTPTVSGMPWYQLDLTSDAEGRATGRILTVGLDGDVTGTFEAPIDTFVSSLAGDRIALARNGEAGSEIAVVVVGSGTGATVVKTPARVLAVAIGSTTGSLYYLAPGEDGIELHRFEQSVGGDDVIDVWKADKDLGPGEFGIVVADDETRLIEQFCGIDCQTRSLDLGSMATAPLDKADGPVIAVTSSTVFAMARPDGSGDVLRITDAAIAVIASDASAARTARTSGGQLAFVVVRIGRDFEVDVMDAEGISVRPPWKLPLGPGGLAPLDLVGSSIDPAADSIAPIGTVLLMPGGRILGTGPSTGAVLPLAGGDPIDFTVSP